MTGMETKMPTETILSQHHTTDRNPSQCNKREKKIQMGKEVKPSPLEPAGGILVKWPDSHTADCPGFLSLSLSPSSEHTTS